MQRFRWSAMVREIQVENEMGRRRYNPLFIETFGDIPKGHRTMAPIRTERLRRRQEERAGFPNFNFHFTVSYADEIIVYDEEMSTPSGFRISSVECFVVTSVMRYLERYHFSHSTRPLVTTKRDASMRSEIEQVIVPNERGSIEARWFHRWYAAIVREWSVDDPSSPLNEQLQRFLRMSYNEQYKREVKEVLRDRVEEMRTPRVVEFARKIFERLKVPSTSQVFSNLTEEGAMAVTAYTAAHDLGEVLGIGNIGDSKRYRVFAKTLGRELEKAGYGTEVIQEMTNPKGPWPWALFFRYLPQHKYYQGLLDASLGQKNQYSNLPLTRVCGANVEEARELVREMGERGSSLDVLTNLRHLARLGFTDTGDLLGDDASQGLLRMKRNWCSSDPILLYSQMMMNRKNNLLCDWFALYVAKGRDLTRAIDTTEYFEDTHVHRSPAMLVTKEMFLKAMNAYLAVQYERVLNSNILGSVFFAAPITYFEDIREAVHQER